MEKYAIRAWEKWPGAAFEMVGRGGIWQAALMLALAVLPLGACSEETTTTTSIVINYSGTVTYSGFSQGTYNLELHRESGTIGVDEGLATGVLSADFVTAFTYSLPMNGNLGNMFLYIFNDFDEDLDDSGGNDASACSDIFSSSTADVTDVNVTITSGVKLDNCP